VYAYSTISYRDSNKKPQNKRKTFAIVPPGTNRLVFNSYGMAVLDAQGLNLCDLSDKYISEISKIINFAIKVDHNSYRHHEISYSNFIEVKDDLIGKFANVKAETSTINRLSNVSNTDNSTLSDNLSSITELNEAKSSKYTDKYFKDYNCSFLDDNSGIQVINSKEDFEVRIFGSQILLEHIARSTGLTTILEDVFPSNWREILTLAFYVCCQNKSLSHCENWLEDMDCLIKSSKLASQRISELLTDITESDRYNFYKLWATYRQEREYIALDVTSISSYSTQIDEIKWGYNRDGEKLPQLNLCLLFGEDSGLPVYSAPYSGSVTDVKAFISIIDQIDFLKIGNNYKLVLDKGFYSQKNINKMLKSNDIKFNISIPLTVNYVKDLIVEYKTLFTENNMFWSGTDILYGTTILYNWDSTSKLYLHIYFNDSKYLLAKQDILSTMVMLRQEAEKDPLTYKNTADHKKFLIYTPTNDPKVFEISFKLDNIRKLYNNKGWFFILSNEIDDYKKSLSIYRRKDCVEKAFYRFKNTMDLNRLRTHSDKTTDNKLFISFISLIIISYIHKNMVNKDLYKKYTLNGLIEKLDKLKYAYSDSIIMTKPITKEQEEIFKSFDIEIR
jgi:transposase